MRNNYIGILFIIVFMFFLVIVGSEVVSAVACTDVRDYANPSPGQTVDVTCSCGPSTGDFTNTIPYHYQSSTKSYERYGTNPVRFCVIASNYGVFGASNACPSNNYDITFRIHGASAGSVSADYRARTSNFPSSCGNYLDSTTSSMGDYVTIESYTCTDCDTQAPTIHNTWTEYPAGTPSAYHPYQFRIWAEVSDDTGVTNVLFPTWSEPNGQDDLVWHQGYYSHTSGGHDYWYTDVDRTTNHPDSSYVGYNGMHIITHVYAYDGYSHQTAVQVDSYIFKDNGYTCSVDGECSSGSCDSDWDSSTKYCHATSSSCPNGPGTSEYSNGYELCSGNNWYKSCSNGLWSSQQSCDTTTDYAFTSNQCGWQSQAPDTCNSGTSGGCTAPSWVQTDCGEFNTSSTSSCDNNGVLEYCSKVCGATCEKGETHDSGVNYCSNGDSYNRIDICGVSGTDCLWANNGAVSDTLNQDCGDYNCNSGVGDCYVSCTSDNDSKCASGLHCYSADNFCYNSSVDSFCDVDSECDGACVNNVCVLALQDAPSGTDYSDDSGNHINGARHSAYIKKNSFKFLKLNINGNVNLSGAIADTNGDKSVFHFGSASRTGIDNVTLIINKRAYSDYVIVCPNLTSLTGVCKNSIELNATNTSYGSYNLINLTDSNYWYIEASASTFSTGAYSEGGSGVNVPEFGIFGMILAFLIALTSIGYIRKIN